MARHYCVAVEAVAPNRLLGSTSHTHHVGGAGAVHGVRWESLIVAQAAGHCLIAAPGHQLAVARVVLAPEHGRARLRVVEAQQLFLVVKPKHGQRGASRWRRRRGQLVLWAPLHLSVDREALRFEACSAPAAAGGISLYPRAPRRRVRIRGLLLSDQPSDGEQVLHEVSLALGLEGGVARDAAHRRHELRLVQLVHVVPRHHQLPVGLVLVGGRIRGLLL
mmetsp:Transcript_6836/g.12993  ORF Transcript_6836/g.12993 Transcript_6836/m.12993 type:complete len:220 (-) Transcript_6836:3000-3659(-)